ncbi:MAG: hypothetical protein ACTHJG_00150 [Rhodanobacteraceae bacterium]
MEEIGKGIPGGIASAAGAAVDVAQHDYDLVRGYLSDAAGIRLNLTPHPGPILTDVAPSQLPPAGWEQKVSEQRQDLDKWLEANRQYHGSGAQLLGGLAKTGTEFAIGAPAGPLGAATVVGGATANDTYDELRAQGVDDATAKEAATAQGSIAAIGAVLPFKVPGVAAKLLGAAGINIGLGVASRGAQHEVLEANGYPEMAAIQKAFDLQQMAADGLAGLFMGFGAHLHEAATGAAAPETAPEPLAPIDRPPPSQVDAARVVADQANAANSGPGTFTTPEAADLHAEVFGRAMDDLRNGRDPHVTADEAQTLAANMVDNPARAATVDNVRNILAADPDAIEAQNMAGVLGEARATVAAKFPDFNAARDAAGPDLAPVTPDPAVDAMARHLEAKYPDALIPQEDGSQITVKEMMQRMREAMANAESDRKLMDAAVACFGSTGGIA